jgi:diadenosine tetraphosphate (Ap4A) HIT family hydrolase
VYVASGQEVFHVHVHVIPRWDKDKLVRYRPAKERIRPEVGAQHTADIIALLDAKDPSLDSS